MPKKYMVELAQDERDELEAVPKKLDGEKEARLVQVACSVPPEGHVQWTVKMLAEVLVRLEVLDRFARRPCGRR